TSARMYGWEVRSFPQYRVYHYRQTGTANRSIWSAWYREGMRDYTIGYHPLFQVARALGRYREKPLLLGSIVFMSGYFSAMLRREKRAVSEEFQSFIQQEQLGRLRQTVSKTSAA
ncbi:MAG: glycosyltransferase family 2 protein, partial [Chloroflexota bacterium]